MTATLKTAAKWAVKGLKSAFSGVKQGFQASKVLLSDSPTPKTGGVVTLLGFETPSVTQYTKKTEKNVFFAFFEKFLCFSLKF